MRYDEKEFSHCLGTLNLAPEVRGDHQEKQHNTHEFEALCFDAITALNQGLTQDQITEPRSHDTLLGLHALSLTHFGN